MNFGDLLKNSKFVNSVYAVAAVGLGLVFFFQKTIEKLALAGQSDALNLLLAFLLFLIVGVIGSAVFFGISKEEIEAEKAGIEAKKAEIEAEKSKNKAVLKKAKGFAGSQTGLGNAFEGEEIEGGSFHQDSRTPLADDPEKKTPPQN